MSTGSATDELWTEDEEEIATTSPPSMAQFDQEFSDYIPLRISGGVSLLREWSSQEPSSATLPALRARADRTLHRWETHLASFKAEYTQYETANSAKTFHIRKRISRRENWISGLKGAIFMWETAHAPFSSPEGLNAGSTCATSASVSHTSTGNFEVIDLTGSADDAPVASPEGSNAVSTCATSASVSHTPTANFEVIDLTGSSDDDAVIDPTLVRGDQASTEPPPRIRLNPRRSVLGSLCRWSIIGLIVMLTLRIMTLMPAMEMTSAQGPLASFGRIFEKLMVSLLEHSKPSALSLRKESVS